MATRRARLVYVVSQRTRWAAFEWIGRELDRAAFDLSFLLLNDLKGPEGLKGAAPPMARHLTALGIPFEAVQYSGRGDLPRAVHHLRRLCRAEGVDIVHAHFMDACLAGLCGAWLAGVRIRIHTRHHAGPFPRSHRAPVGRLYDRLNNRLSTHIVAPSGEVRRALVDGEGVAPRRVSVIPHGFDLALFAAVSGAAVERLRRRYLPPGAGPVVGVVARYEEIKGVHYVIPAFRRLLAEHPRAFLLLANARGRWREVIRGELGRLPAGSYAEVPFEEEVWALYKLFDVFVHVPVGPQMEAFGQVYVEALAAGVPAVCTRAGIAGELLRHRENAWMVEPRSSDAIYAGLRAVLGEPGLRQALVANGRASVRGRFELKPMVRALEQLYARALEENDVRGETRRSR